jgi:hypothetical protein
MTAISRANATRAFYTPMHLESLIPPIKGTISNARGRAIVTYWPLGLGRESISAIRESANQFWKQERGRGRTTC